MTKPARTRALTKFEPETGYRVYLNKFPHCPRDIGCLLFFESRNYKSARHFAEQMVQNSFEWLVEEWHFLQSRRQGALSRFQKFIDNFWIEPIADTPKPTAPFCSRREAKKLLREHPEILAAAREWLFDTDFRHPKP